MPADKIQQTVERFVKDLQQLVAEQAKDALFEALNGEPKNKAVALTPRRGPGRPRSASKRGGRRVRRTAADLEALQAQIIATLKKQPGCTSEELQEVLGMEKKDVQRPLVLLREANKLRTEGQKRAMRYFVRGRG